METAVRFDHGQTQATAMSFTQRQTNHRYDDGDVDDDSLLPSYVHRRLRNHVGRQNHTQQELYKPSRSPLPPNSSRYPFPPSPQLQPQVSQLSNQRYTISAAPAPPTVYRDYRPQQRISLLHSEYGMRPREVLQGGASIHHLEPLSNLGQQPFKKIRLQDHKDLQPLRIDTRDQPGAYNPQVEAISPTLPDHIQQQEDQAFRTTKDELLQQISKVDREIAKTESQITILRKKQQELEESASKPSTKSEVEEDNQPKHQSLAQKIYAENRKKAQSAHAELDPLGSKVEWPIYNQPSDAPLYHENKRKHVTFKRRLLDYFKKRHVERDARHAHLTDTYSKMMQEWLRKVDKIESSAKRKTKEAKNREFFEKVFPELRKQREDKERFNRVGARVKSEADMEEIMDNLQEQDLEDKKMRSYAVIPPLMFDAKQRKLVYQNNNGHVIDMSAVHKSRQHLNVWTTTEKEVFKEKYLQHPKNFVVIASYLEKKSVADCVQYYYLSKKTENYKQLLRKSRQRTRTRNPPKGNQNVVDILTPGVTTRLQREQQQKTVVQQTRDGELTGVVTTNVATTNVDSGAAIGGLSTATANLTVTVTGSLSPVGSVCVPTVTSIVVKTEGSDLSDEVKSFDANNVVDNKFFKESDQTESVKSETVKLENSSSNEGSNDVSVVVVKKEEPFTENSGSEQQQQQQPQQQLQQQQQALTTNVVVENKKKKERRKDKENSLIETSEDESTDLHDKSVQGQCIVCGSQLGPQLQSRPLAQNQAGLYGLREDQIPQNGRVCNTCRCKCVRSRYTHCPLPSCPNSRGRVKRLRSFPQRLQELPPDVREPLLAEFHVPSGVTKCCSACFNRIQRRLGPVEEWPEEEVAQLRNALTELGANWQLVGERLDKTSQQVRSFYSTNRKRLNLETCLGDRKPTLTDEEESGSSTSSCEEPIRERHSSDTISAESPPVNHEQPSNPVRKEDYDSSATETADEGQTPDHYQSSATITPVNPDGQARQNTSPLTVKDLMLNMIEFTLKKTPGVQQTQHLTTNEITPTISSILNNDSNEVTIVSEYNLGNQPRLPQQRNNELSIAKLTPLIAATITPVPTPMATQEAPNRDDLVVLQVQDGREPENLTLDLSIKKNRDVVIGQPIVHAKMRSTEPYMYHQERKSPAVYATAANAGARLQAKLPSPKPANPKAGSITLGTPIISQQRYEGLLRQMTPEPKMGSITQGTPIHVPHVADKRLYENFYGKRAPPQSVPQNANFAAQYRQPAYSVEQQLSNRQIIMNDYITSQQMLGRRDKPQYYPANSPHRTPPPPPQQSQQRQGVIQRHNTRPLYPPPGHEALSSLVDVAVQQPSLPVPSAPHEGLGKAIADNRFQIMQQQQMRQQQQQQRMEVERRYHQQQQQQQQVRQQQQQHQQQQHVARNESTLTAASLIDAIITHQINQTEGGREVVANNREIRPSDRLFQDFHRQQPQSDNGERPPSVISVDLDSESVNKSLTVKELTDSVITHDFGARQSNYFHHQDNVNEQWKRRLQQQQKDEKRSGTPQQQDERQIIRIAQPPKYHVEPVSPPESNHWSEQNFRRYQQAPSHLSAFDYVKNRIVEVMRTEDDKKEHVTTHDKDRSDSPGDMVIDEEKHDDFQQQNFGGYPYVSPQQKDSSSNNDASRNEPEPLLDSKYEPLSDED